MCIRDRYIIAHFPSDRCISIRHIGLPEGSRTGRSGRGTAGTRQGPPTACHLRDWRNTTAAAAAAVEPLSQRMSRRLLRSVHWHWTLRLIYSFTLYTLHTRTAIWSPPTYSLRQSRVRCTAGQENDRSHNVGLGSMPERTVSPVSVPAKYISRPRPCRKQATKHQASLAAAAVHCQQLSMSLVSCCIRNI